MKHRPLAQPIIQSGILSIARETQKIFSSSRFYIFSHIYISILTKYNYFQNECATSRPLLYCALKAKSYCILTEESLADLKNKIKKLETEEGSEGRLYTKLANSHVKNKGVVRSMVSELGIVQYLVALLSNTTISSSFKKLQLYSGIMHLMSMTKVSLSALDDKTQTLDCGICVRPFGHYNTDLKCGNCI